MFPVNPSHFVMFPVTLKEQRVLSNVPSDLPSKFGQTHMKVMFTVLIFGQTQKVFFFSKLIK